MDPVTLALIGGGMQAGGELASGFMNMFSARSAQKAAERMYKHRFRWAMKDMRLAGLNPILAYQQAGGSVPMGAQFTFPNPLEQAGASVRGLGKLEADVELAQQRKSMVRQQENVANRQEELLQESVRKMKVDTEASAASVRELESRAEKNQAEAARTEVDSKLLSTALPGARAQEQMDATQFGEWMRQLNRVIRSATGRDTTSSR